MLHCAWDNMRLLLGQVSTEAVLYIASLRWKERFTDTYQRQASTRSRPKRYKVWQENLPLSILSFSAVQYGDDKEIVQMESRAIQMLQPPTQCTPGGLGKSWRQRRTRPWPSFAPGYCCARAGCHLQVYEHHKPQQMMAVARWWSWLWRRCTSPTKGQGPCDKIYHRTYDAMMLLI